MAVISVEGPEGSATRRPRRGHSARSNEQLWAYIFLAPWLLGFLSFTAGAMLLSFGISFWDTNFLNRREFIGLANYERLLDDPLFWKSLRVTATYSMIAVPSTA